MFKSTKIISTLGPATDSIKIISSLVDSGTDVFRLNFSHGSHEEHLKRIKIIRDIEKKTGQSIGIIADLQGPKFRIGQINNPIFIEKGNIVNFHLNQTVKSDSINSIVNEFNIHLPHPEIFLNILPNENFLINDGKLEFKVKSVTNEKITAEILNSGKMESNKGINFPTIKLQISPLTKKR